MIRFDRDICRDLSIASKREWLETNGLGGYASSTIVRFIENEGRGATARNLRRGRAA